MVKETCPSASSRLQQGFLFAKDATLFKLAILLSKQ